MSTVGYAEPSLHILFIYEVVDQLAYYKTTDTE